MTEGYVVKISINNVILEQNPVPVNSDVVSDTEAMSHTVTCLYVGYKGVEQ